MKVNWVELTTDLEKLLRLRTIPIGLKFLAKAADIENIPGVKRIGHRFLFCQMVTIARTAGWTIAGEPKPNALFCPFILFAGLYKGSWEAFPGSPGYSRVNMWFKTEEDANKQRDAIPRIPVGKFQAVVVAPLSSQKFEPDVILVYANPAQMILLINAIQWTEYERLRFSCIGESSCVDSVIECYLSNKPALGLPCYGERIFGSIQDDELAMAIPPSQLGKTVEGLKELSARGIKYPIFSFGARYDVSKDVQRMYGELPKI